MYSSNFGEESTKIDRFIVMCESEHHFRFLKFIDFTDFKYVIHNKIWSSSIIILATINDFHGFVLENLQSF